MHTQHLYEARTHGYHTFRIPVLAVAPGGAVLAACEARPGSGGDYDGNDLLLRRSTDGGETFEPFVKLVDHHDYGPGPTSNLVLIPDHELGCVHGLFCHDYNRAFYIRSDDEGQSFSRPREITDALAALRSTYPWTVCATGPGHGIILRSGRMIVPTWLSDGSGTEMGPGHRGHRPSVVTSLYSDDRGATWHAGEIACRDGDLLGQTRITNPSETVCAELADGRVMFNIRTESVVNRRLVATSPDGVFDWTIERFDPQLIEPVCMASLIRCDGPDGAGEGRLIFANPDSLGTAMGSWVGQMRDRANLTVQLSEDEGGSWCAKRVIEPGPAGYCHLAALADGRIGCLYEDGMVDHQCDGRYITLARFDLAWIESSDA